MQVGHALPETLEGEALQQAGLNLRVAERLEAELPHLDVVYINAIAWVGDSYEAHGVRYRLSRSSPLKPGAIVLHPLARGEELARDLDERAQQLEHHEACLMILDKELHKRELAVTVREQAVAMQGPAS